MNAELHTKIQGLIRSHDVVLFMKGNRHFPQCGFSATVVRILDGLVPKYETVNVLSDQAIRDGIKEFSQWPTIPQLYVKGEFVGGCDIVKEMHASGELHKLLGVDAPAPPPAPSVTIKEGAVKAFEDAAADAGEDVLRLEIDDGWNNDLYFGPKKQGDIEVKTSGLVVHMDAQTARRANGIVIDFVKGPRGDGFRIDNPNEPHVRGLSAKELHAMHEKGEKLELFDVRGDGERALAKIDWAQPLDRAGQEKLMALPKDTPVAFHCHHGIRSAQVARQVLGEGFSKVYNLEGGIDAWSKDVDSGVRRY
jgi:monothiol glutaredoxin